MEKKEITDINPITFGGITITPVSRLTIGCRNSRKSMVFSGNKQPEIVIIATPLYKKAFRITGEEVALDDLKREFPEITAIPEEP